MKHLGILITYHDFNTANTTGHHSILKTPDIIYIFDKLMCIEHKLSNQ